MVVTTEKYRQRRVDEIAQVSPLRPIPVPNQRTNRFDGLTLPLYHHAPQHKGRQHISLIRYCQVYFYVFINTISQVSSFTTHYDYVRDYPLPVNATLVIPCYTFDKATFKVN